MADENAKNSLILVKWSVEVFSYLTLNPISLIPNASSKFENLLNNMVNGNVKNLFSLTKRSVKCFWGCSFRIRILNLKIKNGWTNMADGNVKSLSISAKCSVRRFLESFTSNQDSKFKNSKWLNNMADGNAKSSPIFAKC